MNCLNVSNHLVSQLKEYAINCSGGGYVIGVSGGIDSAVVSTLCSKTGLPTKVVTLPIHQAPDQVTRALDHIKWLKQNHPNVSSDEIDLTKTFEIFKESIPEANRTPLLLANLRARLRMSALYTFGLLVAGTGNKVEDYGVGFFTKYGDGGVDISPIGKLNKTEVWELGAFLGVDEAIVKAKPTDGLWGDNRSDEDQIGASYVELEWAMDYCDELNLHCLKDIESVSSTVSAVMAKTLTDRKKEVLTIYLQRHTANLHKMNMPSIFEIPEGIKWF